MAKNAFSKRSNILLLTPLFGICSFILLYIIAAYLYSGGSKFDKEAQGFSLIHNYWCDLFDVAAHNGLPNPSRPIAIAAMLVLTSSFGLLWWLLPHLFDSTNKKQKIIQYAGISSMIISAFLFTSYHEEVINFGGLLGGLALTLTFIELYKFKQRRLFIIGVLCLALSCFNYVIYETGFALFLLASIQKITFLVFFVWAGMMNVALYKKERFALREKL